MSDTIKEVVGLYLQLRERKAQIEESIKPKLAGIREDMNKLESWLLEQAEAAGVRSFRTDAGTAFITTQDSATVADWDKTLPYILANKDWDLLEKRVNKTAVRDHIELTGTPPPGVNFTTRRAINVRSPAPE